MDEPANTIAFPGADPAAATASQEARPVCERCYYEEGRGARYWMEVGNRWIDASERQLRRWLADEGLSSTKEKGELFSEIDDAVIEIERNRRVEWSGIVAGHKAGHARMGGADVLVTRTVPPMRPLPSGPDAPELELSSEDGEREWDDALDKCHGWPLLGRYLRGLLSCDRQSEDGAPERFDQRMHFFGWWQRALRSLHAYRPEPGHAILLAGEPECGKSLLIALLAETMGGRTANPLRWIEGSTDFNSEIVTAPLLVIDDEGSQTRIDQRKNLGAKVKQITAVPRIRIEGKNRDAVTLEPFMRLVYATNLEEQNLMVFPPIDNDIEDKVMLFRAYAADFPWPATGTRGDIWQALCAELPAFVHWLLVEFRLPDDLVSQRFGLKHWHHPDILAGIDFLSPENRLLGWIERTVLRQEQSYDGAPLPIGIWKGSATDLEVALKDPESGLSYKERDKVPSANPTIGKYLTALMSRPQLAGRLEQQRLPGGKTRIWTICDSRHAKSDTRNDV